MFERILNVAGESLADKYASTYAGKQAKDLATIKEAQDLDRLLANASARFRNGLSLPPATIMATGLGTGQTEFLASDMIADGFPTNKPCHLHLLYEFGAPREEDDGAMQKSQGFKKIEVFDAAYAIAAHGEQGYAAVFADINDTSGTPAARGKRSTR